MVQKYNAEIGEWLNTRFSTFLSLQEWFSSLRSVTTYSTIVYPYEILVVRIEDLNGKSIVEIYRQVEEKDKSVNG